MQAEIYMLDVAERGESQGNIALDIRRDDQRHVPPTFETMSDSKSPETESQKEELEQASGPEGLARVKDYDRRFAFYPSFSVERSLTLDFQAKCISRLSTEIQILRRELKSEHTSKPSNFASTTMIEGRLESLMCRLAESLTEYGGTSMLYQLQMLKSKTNAKGQDSAWVHARIVENADTPEPASLDQLRLWLDQRSPEQVELYRTKEWYEFRMLASGKGPIEKFVKAIMPISRLGQIILRPFRSHSVNIDNLRFLRYENAVLSWVVSVLLLLGICVFLVLPLALLSYFDTNRNVRVALVLVMCVLVSMFARVIETDEARQVVFVCVYSAVMSGFLSQLS